MHLVYIRQTLIVFASYIELIDNIILDDLWLPQYGNMMHASTIEEYKDKLKDSPASYNIFESLA